MVGRGGRVRDTPTARGARGEPVRPGEPARGRNRAPPGPARSDPGPGSGGLGASGGSACFANSGAVAAGRASPARPLTEVDDLERREEAVLPGQVLPGGLGAVILDEGEAAGAQDVVVGARHRPVEVREAELVVADGAVGHAEGGPGRQAPLQQVLRQHLRGAGLRAGGGARGPGPAQQQPQRGLVRSPQGLHGRRAAAPARRRRGARAAGGGAAGARTRGPRGERRGRRRAARTGVPRAPRRERRDGVRPAVGAGWGGSAA